jgi:membrane protein
VTSTDLRRVPRDVLRGLGRSFPGSDLSLWAAGATFFGVVGIVPLAMLALWTAALVVGPDAVSTGMDAAIGGLPGGHGTPDALRTLTATALDLSGVRAAVLLFPASLYGEGLRRAFLQLAPREGDALTGWRGRLGLLPVVAVAPVLVLGLLAAAPVVAPLYTGGGGRLLLGVLLGFHVVWVLVSVALLPVYGVVAAGRIGARALVVGAFASGSVLSGFLQGFLLFLAIPVEWSLPFGGLPVVGAVAALALWLYLLHVLVLVGYRLTLVLDAGLLRAAP